MFQSRKQDYFNWKLQYSAHQRGEWRFQSRKQDYFNWKLRSRNQNDNILLRFSPASRIILIERAIANNWSTIGISRFQSRKQDYFNWKFVAIRLFRNSWFLFQSRKQDYFNWKMNLMRDGFHDYKFQSRKQDYFNWKSQRLYNWLQSVESFSPASRIILIESHGFPRSIFALNRVSVPQAGLF